MIHITHIKPPKLENDKQNQNTVRNSTEECTASEYLCSICEKHV